MTYVVVNGQKYTSDSVEKMTDQLRKTIEIVISYGSGLTVNDASEDMWEPLEELCKEFAPDMKLQA